MYCTILVSFQTFRPPLANSNASELRCWQQVRLKGLQTKNALYRMKQLFFCYCKRWGRPEKGSRHLGHNIFGAESGIDCNNKLQLLEGAA